MTLCLDGRRDRLGPDGAVEQSNFRDYPLLNISEMRPVEVHYLNSDAKLMGGTGEVGPVTVLPAIANALFQRMASELEAFP